MEKTSRKSAGRKITWIGAGVNALLIILKLIGGIWGQSQALIADAAHSLSDFVTDAVVLVGLRIGGKEPDQDHPFGHARLETLATAMVGIILVLAAAGLGYDAGRRIYFHEASDPTWAASVAAALSILAKELLYRYTAAVGRRINSSVVMANAWHHRSDAFSSVAVLVGATVAQLTENWRIMDAYAALLVTVIVLKVGVDVLIGAFREFTDQAPGPEVLDDILLCAQKAPGVESAHDLRVRTSGGQYQMEIHIVVDGGLTVRKGHEIAKEVERCLYRDVKQMDRIIVHIDPDASPREDKQDDQ